VSFGNEQPRDELPLGERAEFSYSPRQDDLRNFYASCDLWLTASRSEGFNLPAMEAMACRTPVVSTNTGWPSEAIKSAGTASWWMSEMSPRLPIGAEWILSRSGRSLEGTVRQRLCYGHGGLLAQECELFEDALKHACQRAARGEILGHPSPEMMFGESRRFLDELRRIDACYPRRSTESDRAALSLRVSNPGVPIAVACSREVGRLVGP